MIGSINGRLASKAAPQIIVDCGGVGYEIETPMSTFLDLPQIDQPVFLFTHMVVRDDARALFGFATEAEKRLFRALLKVSGVGAKMGLAILSAMTVDSFRRCVQQEDATTLTKIPGVGKKTAERLIIEMRDRIDAVAEGSTPQRVTTGGGDARAEAFDALCALGYRPAEVKRLLGKVDVDQRPAEDILRDALRQAVS